MTYDFCTYADAWTPLHVMEVEGVAASIAKEIEESGWAGLLVDGSPARTVIVPKDAPLPDGATTFLAYALVPGAFA